MKREKERKAKQTVYILNIGWRCAIIADHKRIYFFEAFQRSRIYQETVDARRDKSSDLHILLHR